MKIILNLVLAFLFLNGYAFAQKENKYIREGNKEYEDGRYAEAQTNYLRAIDENSKSFGGAFNLGNALYKQEKYEEAASQFKSLSQIAPDKEVKAKAYHNLGNSLLQAKKYEECIDAYKNALRNNPEDNDTRYNLAYAMQQLKQQQQQEQQNKDKEQDKKEDKKEEEKQDQKQNKQEDKQQQPKEEMTKEEAQRLLEAMEREDKNVQEKVKKQKSPVKVEIEKDW